MKKIFFVFVSFIAFNFLFAQKTKERKDHKQKKDPTFLGVDVDNIPTRTNGLHINGLIKGYSAEKAGLKIGDTLKTINGESVHTFFELINVLRKLQPQQQVNLSFARNGSIQKVFATVSEYPAYLKYNNEEALSQLEGNGPITEVKKAILGVHIKSIWEPYAVLITEFTKNSPAQAAGLKIGDTILRMDNYEFATLEELKYYLSKYKPGDIVTLHIQSVKEKKYIKVTLGEEIIRMRNHSN